MLRRYLTKHNPGVDMEGLNFEAMDKEMKVDEAIVVEGATPKVDRDEAVVVAGQDDPAT